FPEAIQRQMDANVQADWLRRQEELNKGYAISKKETDVKELAGSIQNIESELQSACPLPDYRNAIDSFNTCSSALPGLRADYENKKAAAARYYGQLGRARSGNANY